MAHRHRSFVVDLLGKIGVPILAGTTVGCILSGEFHVLHAVLLAAGLGLTYLGHWLEFHRTAAE